MSQDLLYKLERRFGRLAIPNVTVHIIAAQVIIWILGTLGYIPFSALMFDPALILEGEVWRLFIFPIMPPTGFVLFTLISWLFLHFIGSSLESHFGTFRYNLYLLIGFVSLIVARAVPMFILGAEAGGIGFMSNHYFELSLFYAFAYLYPDYQLNIYFIIPIKVKWLVILPILSQISALFFGGWTTQLLVVSGIINFFLFFGKDIYKSIRYRHRRVRFENTVSNMSTMPLHTCSECGVDSNSGHPVKFRYCSACSLCFCEEHMALHNCST